MMGRSTLFIRDRRRVPALLVGCCLLAFTTCLRSAQAGNLPIPPAAQIDRAQQFCRGVYKADYAQHSKPERLEFALKLLKGSAADDARDDAAMRYVMRTEARDLAAMGGDLALMRRAIDELTAEFALDPLVAISDGLNAAPKAGSRTNAENEQIGGAWIDVLDRAMAAGKYEIAGRAAPGAESGVRFVKDKVRAERIKVQAKTAREGAQLEEAAGPARLVLSTHPDDAAANLATGGYLCFLKGSWTEGLPYLAKGTKDDSLKKVTALDLAAPTEIAGRVALADGWLEIASAQPDGIDKNGYRSRASYWYAKALPKSTGLVKAKIKQRLTELPKVDPGPADPEPPAQASTEKPPIKKVVYICDGSGAMIDVLADARTLISKSAGNLDESQSYVILIAQETGVAASSETLVPATDKNKQLVKRFLISHPCGGAPTPLPSLSAAFDLKPDAIYFFTSADFADNAAVARELSKLNRDRISFNFTLVNPTGKPTDFPTLQKIARDNGGELRVEK